MLLYTTLYTSYTYVYSSICIHDHIPSHPIHLTHLVHLHLYTEQQAQAGTRHHAIRHTRVDRADHRSLPVRPHGLDDRRHDQRGDHRGKMYERV